MSKDENKGETVKKSDGRGRNPASLANLKPFSSDRQPTVRKSDKGSHRAVRKATLSKLVEDIMYMTDIKAKFSYTNSEGKKKDFKFEISNGKGTKTTARRNIYEFLILAQLEKAFNGGKGSQAAAELIFGLLKDVTGESEGGKKQQLRPIMVQINNLPQGANKESEVIEIGSKGLNLPIEVINSVKTEKEEDI